MTLEVAVSCRSAGDGWLCTVRVGQDVRATEHDVTVSHAELASLAPGDADPTRLVKASFAYLLERERRESILRRFAISEIGRYFPGYPAEISARQG